MQARKWIFSSPKVIEVILTEEQATEIAINSSQDLITKTLGICGTVLEMCLPPLLLKFPRNFRLGSKTSCVK